MCMQSAFLKAEELADHVKEYVNNRITAVKLRAAEKSSKMLSNMIAIAVVAAIMLVFAIFISMAAAYALSARIGTAYSGFLIVGGVWLVVAIIIWLSREKILRIPIMNKMLFEMFSDEEDN
jgi:ABC-type glycerol-3-phosphate transport system permease component